MLEVDDGFVTGVVNEIVGFLPTAIPDVSIGTLLETVDMVLFDLGSRMNTAI